MLGPDQDQHIAKLKGALLGELFVDGLDEFVEVEGFFEDAASAKEFGDVEEIAFALGTGHGNDLCIEIFPRQLQGGFETVGSWHQNIHKDQVYFVLLVEPQTFSAIAGFEHMVFGPLKDFLQKGPDRFFVVDNKNCGHGVRITYDRSILPMLDSPV